MILPVILAGGSGTRLWPLSRSLFPKQLLRLTSQYTMLQDTILRLRGLDRLENLIVVCNDEYRFMVAEQLRQINIKPSSIILEPVGRNTAPALAVAAIRAIENGDDPTLLILPADHHIQWTDQFQNAVKLGFEYARSGRLITFGIVPKTAETGYGYIKMGKPIPLDGVDQSAVSIDAFVEKPDLKTAKKYLDSGTYCWNSGMFMFKASKALEGLQEFVPSIVSACRQAIRDGKSDLDFFRLDSTAFSTCPSDSIDYAVMEKTKNGAMIPMVAGWDDLGSWEALWQAGEKDNLNNVIKGDVVTEDVKASYLHSEGRLIAAVGLKNHIIVETADAVMISPRDRVRDVKRLVDQLKQQEREETHFHKRRYRPWGTVDLLAKGARFKVNRITVKPDGVLSLQKHLNRSEHWIVVRGSALVTKEGKQMILEEGQSTYIFAGIAHRLENQGKTPLELVEVQIGGFIGEDDVIRLEDSYGRHIDD